VPEKNTPSLPEAKTEIPSSISYPSGKYSNLVWWVPVPAKIACAPSVPRVTGILLFKSPKSKLLKINSLSHYSANQILI